MSNITTNPAITYTKMQLLMSTKSSFYLQVELVNVVRVQALFLFIS